MNVRPPPSATDLRSLRDKYERMLSLRTVHERARRDATFSEPDPRKAMAALAEEFPGALRELDSLPLEVMVERIDALLLAERDPTAVVPWMAAQSAFHRLARGALAAKRWLGGTRDITAETTRAFVDALPALARAEDAELFADDLPAIASPPRGRLMDLVHERLAEWLGVSVAEARALVFTQRRRRRNESGPQ